MHKKRVGSDDPVLGWIIRTGGGEGDGARAVCDGSPARELRKKGGEGGGAHQEPILGVDLGGEGPKKRIDTKGWSSGDTPMAAGDGGLIPAGKARARLGEVRGRWRTR